MHIMLHPQRRFNRFLFSWLFGSYGWIHTEFWRAITGFLGVTANPEHSGTDPCCVRMTSHWLFPETLSPLDLNTCTHVCNVKSENITLYWFLFCRLQVLSQTCQAVTILHLMGAYFHTLKHTSVFSLKVYVNRRKLKCIIVK